MPGSRLAGRLAAGLALGLCIGMLGLTGCGSNAPERPAGEPGTSAPSHAGGESSTAGSGVAQTIQVRSPDLTAGQPIPSRFTCDGPGTSPALSWQGVPQRAAAVAVVVDDPDAPGGDYVHWVVFDLPAGTDHLDRGGVPASAVQAESSAGTVGYTPPCPPSGTHQYRFTVYALAHPTGLPQGVGTERALDAIGAAAIARGRLVAPYRHGGG